MAPFPAFQFLTSMGVLRPATYALELLLFGAVCFGLERLDMELIATHPVSIPIALAPGFAVAAVLLRGLRIWPALFLGFLAASASALLPAATTAGSSMALATAATNGLAALVAGYLATIWADGRRSFETSADVAGFAAISIGPAAILGTAVGVTALWLMGGAATGELGSIWSRCWLRVASGILVVAPALVLWAPDGLQQKYQYRMSRRPLLCAAAFIVTTAMSFVAFSPLLELPVNRVALGLVALAPLVWTALNGTQRETAVCTIILSAFAVWAAWPGEGPFGSNPDEALRNSAIFLMSASVLGTALSADVAQRESAKLRLRFQEQNLRMLLATPTWVWLKST